MYKVCFLIREAKEKKVLEKGYLFLTIHAGLIEWLCREGLTLPWIETRGLKQTGRPRKAVEHDMSGGVNPPVD